MTTPLYAIARKVPDTINYLTAGKPYEATLDQPTARGRRIYTIRDDTGYIIRIRPFRCQHLCGGQWTIKPAAKLTAKQKERLENGSKD